MMAHGANTADTQRAACENSPKPAAPKVSVIVPVYNVAPYLALGMQSVRTQTLHDIEVICVDDGSTDESGEILDMLAALDSRFRVVHQKNGGVSSAKNAGLTQAHGQYIMFFDPDDMMRPDACTRVAAAFDKTGADVVGFSGAPLPEWHGYTWLNDALNTRDAAYEGFNINVLMREKTRPFAWRTACTHEFLQQNGIRYDEAIRYGEDQVFQFAVYARSRRTVLISDKLINYRVLRDGSFMYGSHRDDMGRIREHIQIVDNVLGDWQSLGILAENQEEMFDWTVEFLMRDLVARTQPKKVSEVAAQIDSVWRKYFPEELLGRRERDKRFAKMMRMVLHGEGAPSHLEARFIDWRYSTYRLGAPFVVRRMLEHVNQGHIGNIGRKLKNALPIDTRQKRAARWVEEERRQRKAAQLQLEAEYRTLAHSN